MYYLQKNHRFVSTSFEDSALYENIGSGDVVYFDPPYVPASDTASFTDYAKEGFTYDQQVQLAELAESLSNRGAKVIISNHDVPTTRELYKNAEIYSLEVSRSISAKGSSRKKAKELIAVY
jgi:DNA adenine methylase